MTRFISWAAASFPPASEKWNEPKKDRAQPRATERKRKNPPLDIGAGPPPGENRAKAKPSAFTTQIGSHMRVGSRQLSLSRPCSSGQMPCAKGELLDINPLTGEFFHNFRVKKAKTLN